LLITHSQSKI
jgi:YCII-related domain.